jgi:hypothetical protein
VVRVIVAEHLADDTGALLVLRAAADVQYGRREEILRRRKEVEQRTLALRKQFHQAVRERQARGSVH